MRLQRGESDYFMGAYLLNLVAVEMLFAGLLGAIIILTHPDTPWSLLQWGGFVLMLGGAVGCYPFAEAIWLAADLIFRPLRGEELEWHRNDGWRSTPAAAVGRYGRGCYNWPLRNLGKHAYGLVAR